MSCKHGNWAPCELCDAESALEMRIEELELERDALLEQLESARANTRLIAACDPDTIRELLAERDQLAADLEAAESDGLEQARLNGMGSEREAALLSKLEAAEKERDSARKLADSLALALNTSNHERDALRAKIEAMENQEPVAFALYSGWALKAAYHKEHEACEQRDRRQLSADLGGSLEAYRVVPLYLLPGAKGEKDV